MRPSGRRSWILLGLTAMGWVGLQVVGEVVGGGLLSLGWVGAVAVLLGLAASLGRWLILRAARDTSDPDAARADQPVPLPPVPDLVGRSGELAAAVDRAGRQGLLLVHGPRGIGTSAVAVAAAHRLAAAGPAGPDGGVYADLRAGEAGGREPAERARVRVLAALGLLPPRAPTGEAAYEQVARELRDTGRVLVLDNVRSAEQVEWLVRPIAGTCVLVAGDLPPVPGMPDLPVGVLAAEAAQALLAADPAVADRVRPGRAVATLARHYLKSPVVVLALRSYLAANPEVGVPALLADLDRWPRPAGPGTDEPSALLRTVLALQTQGASAAARQLVALLPHVPLTWLSSAATAALLDRPRAQAQQVLDELARRGLLVAVSPSRYRVPREARALGLADRPDERPAALARLVAYYAGEATEWVEALRGSGSAPTGLERPAQAWFRREDLALLALLKVPEDVPLPRWAASRLALVADALDWWFTREGRLPDRRVAATRAEAAAAALGDLDGRVTALLRLAAVSRTEGELDEAADHLRTARDLGAAGDARLLTGLGVQALLTGDPAGARDEFERARTRRSRRDAVGRVIDSVDLGAVLIVQGRLAEAARLLEEVGGLALDAGDPAGSAHVQELLGIVAARQHLDPEKALAEWAQAQLLFERLHDDQGQARCLLHRGTVLLDSDPDAAMRMLERSLALRGAQTTGVGVAQAHAQLATLAQRDGDAEAVDLHRAEALAALAPWEGRIDPPAAVAELRRRLSAATGPDADLAG